MKSLALLGDSELVRLVSTVTKVTLGHGTDNRRQIGIPGGSH